jgi:enoyl-CoA hydratase/carnithine racemase
MQDACSCLERCEKPVVAAVQGACFGAGVDLITAADIRVCAPCARFCVKEIDLAITADLGTLQRLPGIIGEGRAREMALSARVVDADTAMQYGLVTRVASSSDKLQHLGPDVAEQIARKPSLAAVGTKRSLLYSRDKSVDEGLKDVTLWNASMLWSHELQQATAQIMQRPRRSRL